MLVTSAVQLERLLFHAIQPHLVRPRVGRQILGHLVALALVADQLHRSVDPDLNCVEVGPIILLGKYYQPTKLMKTETQTSDYFLEQVCNVDFPYLQTNGNAEQRDCVGFPNLQLDAFLHGEFQVIIGTPLRP